MSTKCNFRLIDIFFSINCRRRTDKLTGYRSFHGWQRHSWSGKFTYILHISNSGKYENLILRIKLRCLKMWAELGLKDDIGMGKLFCRRSMASLGLPLYLWIDYYRLCSSDLINPVLHYWLCSTSCGYIIRFWSLSQLKIAKWGPREENCMQSPCNKSIKHKWE